MTNATTTTVNGWSNWQTYYVASEIISTCAGDYDEHADFSPAMLKDHVTQILTEDDALSPKVDYIVNRFIAEVNFHEISQNIEDDFNSERISDARCFLTNDLIPEMREVLMERLTDYLVGWGIQNNVHYIVEELIDDEL